MEFECHREQLQDVEEYIKSSVKKPAVLIQVFLRVFRSPSRHRHLLQRGEIVELTSQVELSREMDFSNSLIIREEKTKEIHN